MTAVDTYKGLQATANGLLHTMSVTEAASEVRMEVNKVTGNNQDHVSLRTTSTSASTHFSFIAAIRPQPPATSRLTQQQTMTSPNKQPLFLAAPKELPASKLYSSVEKVSSGVSQSTSNVMSTQRRQYHVSTTLTPR